MTFKFSKEDKDRLTPQIQEFFAEKVGEKLGNMDAGFLIDFFVSKVGPVFYNQGLADARAYVRAKMADVDEGFYSLEKAVPR